VTRSANEQLRSVLGAESPAATVGRRVDRYLRREALHHRFQYGLRPSVEASSIRLAECHNPPVIPIMIVFGVVLGRCWRCSIVAGGIVWTMLLIATDSMPVSSGEKWLEAILIGVVNTAVGVAPFLLARLGVDAARSAFASIAKQ
jgi:hypothetical protein